MEPNLHSALHGKVFVDAIGKNLTPAQLKQEIDSAKQANQGLGARIVNTIIGIFRSDAKRAAKLENEVVEFTRLLQKVTDLETAKSNSPDKKLTKDAEKDLEESGKQAFKLGMHIGKLWKIPSVRALYLESAVKNAVKDGQAELRELRSKVRAANDEYGSFKNDFHRLGNLLVNNIADMRKEVDGLQKKKEAVSRVLELDAKIEELSTNVTDSEFDLSQLKFYDAADRASLFGEIQRGDRELQELIEKQEADPSDEDLKSLVEGKRAAVEEMKQQLRNEADGYKDSDVKQLHEERNSLITKLERDKALLAEAKAERRPLVGALQSEVQISQLLDYLDDLRGELASLDKSKPEELAMDLTKLQSNLAARQIVAADGNRLQETLMDREKKVKDLLKDLHTVRETVKLRMDRGNTSAEDVKYHEEMMSRVTSQIDPLLREIEKLKAQQKEESPLVPSDAFPGLSRAEGKVAELIAKIHAVKKEQVDLENWKNDLINDIEDLKADLTDAKEMRRADFTGDLRDIDDIALEEIDIEIAQKKHNIESMEADLVDITTRPNYDVGAPRPAYHELLPVEHKILADQLFKGVIGELDEATANLQQLADEVSGTAAQADVLQLLKDLEDVKKEIHPDIQTVINERAEIAVEREREKRDVPTNAILKNRAAAVRLADEMAVGTDELARLTLERDQVAAEIRDLEAHPEMIKPQDTEILRPRIRQALLQARDIAKVELKRLQDLKLKLRTTHEVNEVQEKIEKAEQHLKAKQQELDNERTVTETHVIDGKRRELEAIEEAIGFQRDRNIERDKEIRRLDTETRRLEAEVQQLEEREPRNSG